MSTLFHMPVHMIYGRGCINQNVQKLCIGKKALLVTGQRSAKACGAYDDVTTALESQGVAYELFDQVGQNPLLSTCRAGAAQARACGADYIIGIGGGSPMDAAKAVAVFATNEHLTDKELFSNSWPNRALPFILVGTTAGTGSEVTPFSIMTSDADGRKRSFGNLQTYAALSFGDPRYTDSLPLNFTLSTMLDAFCHAVEAYFASNANDISDMMALEGAARHLEVYQYLRDGDACSRLSPAQRDTLYEGSIFAGFALNNCGTCFCHSLGYFLSESYDIPHGFACVIYLPALLERAAEYLPEKTAAFYQVLGINQQELFDLLACLCMCDFPTLTEAEIDSLCARWAVSPPANFGRSPGSFTAEDAGVLLRRCFLRAPEHCDS